MRGGAIPILAWGTLLLVLCIGNWVWDDKPVNGAAATAAVVIVYAFGDRAVAGSPRGDPARPARAEDGARGGARGERGRGR